MYPPATRFSCKISLYSKIFPAILIFIQKNPGVRTFIRNFFGSFRFQTGKNPAGKFSVQNFSGKKKFAAKKKYGFSDSLSCVPGNDLRRRSELVRELTSFFQLSRQLFLKILTFNPKFFAFFNFQAKKNPAKRISGRKFLAGKNFRPCGQEQIGRKIFFSPRPVRRKLLHTG